MLHSPMDLSQCSRPRAFEDDVGGLGRREQAGLCRYGRVLKKFNKWELRVELAFELDVQLH